jgi:primosomal protein N' (replication factor Y)
VAEEVAAVFPQARTLIMSSDMMDSTAQYEEALQRILCQDVDIILGTQMMAKGHHFPQLTLVGVVDGDLGLSGGDLRACEKTYQLLHQVAGRCGRADLPGTVLIQTFNPEHPVMQALVMDEKDQFLEQELIMREHAHMPPFHRLASVIVSSPKADQIEQIARNLGRRAPTMDGVELFGPAPAPLAMIRRWHRWRFLLRAPKPGMLQAYLRAWLGSLPKMPGHIKIQIDMDPMRFL